MWNFRDTYLVFFVFFLCENLIWGHRNCLFRRIFFIPWYKMIFLRTGIFKTLYWVADKNIYWFDLVWYRGIHEKGYTLSIYPSAHIQLRRHLPNPFREFPCSIVHCQVLHWTKTTFSVIFCFLVLKIPNLSFFIREGVKNDEKSTNGDWGVTPVQNQNIFLYLNH